MDFPSVAFVYTLQHVLYLYNILQLFFVTVLAINDTRLFHLDAMMALNVHPQGNSDISVGNIFGKFPCLLDG